MKKIWFLACMSVIIAVYGVIFTSCEGKKDVSIKTIENSESTAIDLGLPSGLLWATCNVGATSPEQAGLYFAWGETVGYTAEQVKAGIRSFNSLSYIKGLAASISTDLSPVDGNDAARVNMGGSWRMPTKEEWEELLNNTYQEWVQTSSCQNSQRGLLLTSKVNGKSIFLPAAGECYKSSVDLQGSFGYYWSASWGSASGAWDLYFSLGHIDTFNNTRFYGRSVRGVCE